MDEEANETGSSDLNPDQETALLCLESVKQLYLQVIVLHKLLDRFTPPEEDWRSLAEREMALNEGAVRSIVDGFRRELLGLERVSPPMKDWLQAVQQLVESAEPNNRS